MLSALRSRLYACCAIFCIHSRQLCQCGFRTLTPFGFQAEERTLWQAPDTYAMMSPFQNADKIKKPLLLIHGADDNNTGACCCHLPNFSCKSHNRSCFLLLVLQIPARSFAGSASSSLSKMSS